MFAYHGPKGLNQGELPPYVEESASMTAVSPAHIRMCGVYFCYIRGNTIPPGQQLEVILLSLGFY